MYIPREFRIDDREVLFDLMERFSFATLVTIQDGVPQATQVPFTLDRGRGENGTLVAHLARANGQWQTLRGDQETLVIFQGPHTYITPSWYENHPSVPTWNYMTVQARGRPHIIDAEPEVRAILARLVDANEAPQSGWNLDSAEEYVAAMWKRIVAFEIEVTSLEGKFKLSQNRPQGDRLRVAEGLEAERADADSANVAAAVRRFSLEPETP